MYSDPAVTVHGTELIAAVKLIYCYRRPRKFECQRFRHGEDANTFFFCFFESERHLRARFSAVSRGVGVNGFSCTVALFSSERRGVSRRDNRQESVQALIICQLIKDYWCSKIKIFGYVIKCVVLRFFHEVLLGMQIRYRQKIPLH